MKNPVVAVARLVIRWASTNKASRQPVLLKQSIVSSAIAGQSRLIVATVSRRGPVSKGRHGFSPNRFRANEQSVTGRNDVVVLAVLSV
ncbi:MAG: hypothetical protein JNL58_31480 [Planctomyces sp.]|nr:hypothetical protein [Planctomyces sp.]